MRLTYPIVLVPSVILLAGCGAPKVVVDPTSISSEQVYKADLAECTTVSQQYDLTDETIAGGALGAGVGAVAASTLLGTVGTILFPSGALVAAGGGATIGAGLSKNKESKAREVILAGCMKEKGYKAYTPH